MSNIIPISGNPGIQAPATVKKSTDISFKDSLNKALDAPGASESLRNAPSLGEIQSPSILPVDSPAENIVAQTNNLLDLLASYAEDLENPSKSLKEIAPVLDTIHDHAEDLLRETENLNTQDEKLKKIASDVALTARLELIKFYRGDYV